MSGEFSKFPVEVYTKYGRQMGIKGIALYVALSQHADNKTGECWPSLRKIEKETGMSRHTIIAATKLLEYLEVLKTEKRHRQSTVYTLRGAYSPHFAKKVVQNQHSSGAYSPQGGAKSTPQLDSLTRLNELNIKNKELYSQKLERNELGLPTFSTASY